MVYSILVRLPLCYYGNFHVFPCFSGSGCTVPVRVDSLYTPIQICVEVYYSPDKFIIVIRAHRAKLKLFLIVFVFVFVDGCQKSSSIVYYLQNGYIHFSRPKESPQIYPKGTVATFTCRLGFFLSGTRSATCQSTQWSYTGDQTTCIGAYDLLILIS